MKYKLILSDIDGTLLNDQKELLPSTEKTIRGLVASGVLFATASGRTIPHNKRGICAIQKICSANAYINGAFVEASNGEVLVDSPIKEEEAALILEQCKRIKASFVCVFKEDVIANLNHPSCDNLFKLHHGSYSVNDSLTRFGPEAYYIGVVAEDIHPVVAFAAMNLPDIQTGPIIRFNRTGLKGLSFQNKGANKGTALERIAEYYGVNLKKTMAIGDDLWNDGPMITAAGCGVAMKNAHQEIIRKAQYVTMKNNNEDGVGVFLKGSFGS